MNRVKFIRKEVGGKPRIPACPFMNITEKQYKKFVSTITVEITERLKQKVVSVNNDEDRTKGVHLLGRIDDIADLFRNWGVQYVGQELIERLPAINVVEETRDERWPEGIIRITDLETGRSSCILSRAKYGPLGPGFNVKGEMEVALAI